jgi:hypothetical protein
MKTQRKFTRSRAIKAVGFFVATAFLVSGSIPANAANTGCIFTPTLDNFHKSTTNSLGNSVTANSWQWQPGSDSSNASLSSLGTKVSVVSGNLRNITLGVLRSGIPQTQDLRVLTDSNYQTVAAINGDYFDDSGPWNAMVESGQVTYSPPGKTEVIGVVRKKVVDGYGYRTTGTVTIGTRKFNITGVNQLEPGSSSIVLYKGNFIRPLTPKGTTTLLIKAGKLIKVYSKGAAISAVGRYVIQVKGYLAAVAARMKVNSKVKFSLLPAPTYEERIAADSITTYGKISSKSNSLSIDSVNYTNLGPGATLFDSSFRNTTNSGRATLRIMPDSTGKLIVRKIYKAGDTRNISKAGTRIKVDNGGFIVQANSAQAVADVRKFKDGDTVTISTSYKAEARSSFVTAAGRGPRIVQGGKMVWICAQHSKEHRPRSAIGWNQDGQIWFVTSSRGLEAFDFGYRQGGSTSSQMAQWLLQLGATEAILLDGGSSTAMYIDKPDEGPRLTRFDLPDNSWVRNLSNGFSLQRRD